jgi:TonB family protein
MSISRCRRSITVALLFCSLFVRIAVSTAQTPFHITAEHQRGIDMFRQGHSDAAVAHFESLLKKNNKDEISLYYLALSLERQDKLKDARKRLENAVKVNPNFARAYSALSYIDARRNKNADALKYAQRALSIEPGLPEAHYVVGLVSLRSHMPKEALNAAEEAIKLAPEMATAHLLRSMALLSIYTMAVTNVNGPRSFRSKSQPLTPEERERRRERRAERAGAFAEAAKSLETYLRLQPNDPSAPMWRDQLDTLKVYATEASKNKESEGVEKQLWASDELTTKPRVLYKPEPNYTEQARNRGVEGTVVLRAVFASDGTIRHILILAGLPEGLTERAVNAARRIKFEPATVNGVPVSTTIQLEYNFKIF